MQRTTLFNVVRLISAATVLSCVGSDAITRPDSRTNKQAGGAIPGPMSRYSPQPGSLSATSPAGALNVTVPGPIELTGAQSAQSSVAAIVTSRMLWQNTTTGERSIWVMGGTSFSSAVLLPTVPTAWSIAGSGDFNGDGQADILWQNLTTGDRSIWFMNGNTFASAAMLPSVSTQWVMAGVGDFNADGKPDIVWQNPTTGDRSIWFMNGSTYSSAALLPNVPTVWRIVAVGDFNSDGKPDLVWQRPTTGETSIWFMNGSNYVSAAILPTVPAAWRVAGAADFDGDTDSDLVWQQVITGERSIWLMNGSVMAGAAILPTVPVQWSIAGMMAGPPAPAAPAAPSGLTAVPASPSQINLTWVDNSNNETEFRVEQCVGATCTSFVDLGSVPVDNTAANITGLAASTAYRYRVRAHNAVGYSGYSNIASATTLPPSQITVFATYDNGISLSTSDATIANKVYSNSDLAVGCSYAIGPFVSNFFCSSSLFRFDAAQPQITGRAIASAYLQVQPYLLPADLGTVYAANAVAAAWNPATVTWNTQPTIFTFGQVNFSPPSTAVVPVTLDVTAFVRNWANGTWTNNGIMLRDLAHSTLPTISLIQLTGFYSLEYFDTAANRPRLIITFQ